MKPSRHSSSSARLTVARERCSSAAMVLIASQQQPSALAWSCRQRRTFIPQRRLWALASSCHGWRMLPKDGGFQLILVGVGYLALGLFWNLIRLFEADAPIEKQAQLHLHRMDSGFHDYKTAFRHRFQFVRCHQWTLDHLQRLCRIVFALADRSTHNRAAAERLGQLHCGL